jgi:urocanate hydratase
VWRVRADGAARRKARVATLGRTHGGRRDPPRRGRSGTRARPNLDAALAMIERACVAKSPVSVVLVANCTEVYPELVRRGATPDVAPDQTAAHDLVHGDVPRDSSFAEADFTPVGPARLNAAAMARPTIMTERMNDVSDAVADWPLLDAMAMCASSADRRRLSGHITRAG